MRYKYPHIIDGGVASSAPFLTVAGKRPRSEFWKAVTNVCYRGVNSGMLLVVFKEVFSPKTNKCLWIE